MEVNAELLKAEYRDVPSPDMARRWRELCGPITGAVSLTFSANLFRGGAPIVRAALLAAAPTTCWPRPAN